LRRERGEAEPGRAVNAWTRAFVRADASLRDVLETIDAAELQIALVVDEETRLCGVITDGDVRRALLRGHGLDALASDVMTRDPVTAPPDMKLAAIERLMLARSLNQVPVVDERRLVVGLALYGKLLPRERVDNEVILMVGGLGSRLGTLTKHVPKPLLRVGDKPILEIIIDSLLTQGFHRFRLAVNYKAELIERHFGNGGRWGAEINYVRESQPLGTCGAIGLVTPPPDEPFLVMNGDILAKIQYTDLLDYHRSHGGAATMAVREYSVQIPFGVTRIDDRRVYALAEKPTERYFVNGGIYVLDPKCLALIPRDTPYDMTTLLNDMLARDMGVYSYPVEGYWLDVGRVADFQQAHADFEEHWHDDESDA
jgi:dTDP-glucose pyrophosphorylase